MAKDLSWRGPWNKATASSNDTVMNVMGSCNKPHLHTHTKGHRYTYTSRP